MFLYYCVVSCSNRFSVSLQLILTLDWKHLQRSQPPKYPWGLGRLLFWLFGKFFVKTWFNFLLFKPKIKYIYVHNPGKYNFRSPFYGVLLWKLCSIWSFPSTCYLNFSIVSKLNQKHWREVKGILLKCCPAQTKAEWIKATWNNGRNTHHEHHGVENTHVHTSIPLNSRCELCNLWHSKIFHRFTGEKRACSHAPLLYWRSHRWWNKTQMRERLVENGNATEWETYGGG